MNAEQLLDLNRTIADILEVAEADITGLQVLKKGMTNHSFTFQCNAKQYILRIPGEGTDYLINREQEYQVYKAIQEEHICDNIIYLNPETGYKITEYMPDIHNCNPNDWDEVERCMYFLHKFHERKLTVPHEFSLFHQIEFYESLWQGRASVYPDYSMVKQQVFSLKTYIDKQDRENVLTHIDAVPDNFLLSEDSIALIDWEYAGMQDPHVDIAMFAVYSFYDREQIDRLIDLYFANHCTKAVRLKLYCYVAAAGLLWSNWCEYKGQRGIEFGAYSTKQYDYAKEFYQIFMDARDGEEDV